MDVTVHIGSTYTRGSEGEPELQFASQTFDRTNIHEFETFIDTEASGSNGLLLIVVEQWRPWFRAAVHIAMPNFPLYILHDIESGDETIQTTATLPTLNRNDRSLCFVMDNINVFPKSEGVNRNSLNLGAYEARRLALATWICPVGGITSQPHRPIAVMVGVQNKVILQQLYDHYFEDDWHRWNRLCKVPYWLYLDLYGILTSWDKVWDVARRVVLQHEAELQGYVKAPPILKQARALHRDTATNIALREHIRIHKASIAEYEHEINSIDKYTEDLNELSQRIRIISKALDYYQSTAETNLEQLQNLLSLAFNIETAGQGLNVAALNMFAFVFLPLSFVASIFGMTTMTAPAHWYPVAGIGTLFITGLLVGVARRYQNQRNSPPAPSKNLHEHNPPDEEQQLEKPPSILQKNDTSQSPPPRELLPPKSQENSQLQVPVPPSNIKLAQLRSLSGSQRTTRNLGYTAGTTRQTSSFKIQLQRRVHSGIQSPPLSEETR